MPEVIMDTAAVDQGDYTPGYDGHHVRVSACSLDSGSARAMLKHCTVTSHTISDQPFTRR